MVLAMAEISLVVPSGTDPAPFADAIAATGGHTTPLAPGATLPDKSTGLLLAGEGDETPGPAVSAAVLRAAGMGKPVLGIGWGMYAINEAYGGGPPACVDGHGPEPGGASGRHRIFLAPGAKLSYTIGGSGWVTVNSAHRLGITEAQLGPDLLASAFAEDRVIEAVELPGRNWVIGVQWRAHLIEELPSGFDSLLLAFVERAGF